MTIKEKVTSDEIDIEIEREEFNVKKLTRKAEKLSFKDIITPDMTDPLAIPPLRLVSSDNLSIEFSKRRFSLPFFHRNMDYDELIICLKGSATWQTETGEFELKEGEMLIIPRGIAHRPVNPSNDYMALEIKSKNKLSFSK
ncbi:cupin domain-containing protein [Caldisphaera lagunensis DSM 15908]|uniref:Cupin domain-containing protein n=1 Tax=Caldisphaera lagunensis (strain DSM 15908 / JCM 11604 / ANMR 0165 / IC-154) TaxID=1056495 RepID=L0A7R5_CALLD|nr:cupin domain-containing protein [Caldisphaera lagunensis]AFZ69913.1 cupin domain-containing protein [Caldisphaera lagunensis DSM 15908]